MKVWQKIVIATIGSGFIGGLTFSAGMYPEWSAVMAYLSLAISGKRNSVYFLMASVMLVFIVCLRLSF